ncbi:uncharacterized protein C8Q71DRAFT_728602 [Rhodofomes roseus]|uniref:Uncharacterized protein n=1 Tax=Rhodofomes roseus TaxID=34475 RepID=A0ABQ8JX02_9APHY|nr:uncharacterized protein C8Q71DRAFT_728602 [Rhodofomes roseus]KAH9828516.1 hypothetical protein C8Q71DRAFT_728602 [Rhodofomes roseus]
MSWTFKHASKACLNAWWARAHQQRIFGAFSHAKTRQNAPTRPQSNPKVAPSDGCTFCDIFRRRGGGREERGASWRPSYLNGKYNTAPKMSTNPPKHVAFVLDGAQKRTNIADVDTTCGSGWLIYAMQSEIAERFLAEPKLHGYIYDYLAATKNKSRVHPGQKYTEVIIAEDVLWAYRLEMHSNVKLTILLWDPFRDFIMATYGTKPQTLKKVLVHQGFDILVHNASQLMHDCNDAVLWGDDPLQKDEYYRRLRSLTPIFPVWPPLQAVRYSAKTFSIIQALRSPPYRVPGLQTFIPREQVTVRVDKWRMYKREATTHGIHVHDGRIYPRGLIDQDRKQNRGRWVWFEMPRHPSLSNAGQIRVYMSQGRLTHVVHTTRVGNQLEGSPVRCVLRPEEIQMPNANLSTGAFVGIFEREGGTMEARTKAMEEIREMCNHIISNMTTHLEEKSMHGGFCLAQCCRLDFGVLPLLGSHKWIITGMTWGCGMDLYASVDPQNAVVFIDTVLDAVINRWNA